jgi:hypothetical protein
MPGRDECIVAALSEAQREHILSTGGRGIVFLDNILKYTLLACGSVSFQDA